MIFDIQNYCLYDGPGIRTCVFFKGCPLNCDWCHNPESIRRTPQISYDAEKCAGCGRCAAACPYQALRLEGAIIKRNWAACEACGRCVETCPNEAVERIGYKISAAELITKLKADIPFFEESGGGVTITGGEPTLQPEFLLELLALLRENGIHTCLETCGQFGEKLEERLVDAVDLFLFDLKQIEPEAHQRGTGAGNDKILRNFSRILDGVGPVRIIPRIPLIPDYNTDPECIVAFISFLKLSGYKGPVHLLPYHEWAAAKYKKLGLEDREQTYRLKEKIDKARILDQFHHGGFATGWSG